MPVTTVSVLKQRRVKIKAPGGGKQAQNLFLFFSKLSKAAEMIAEVNRNLAQDSSRLGTKQVEQMQRPKTKADTVHAAALSLVHNQMRRVQMYCLLHRLFSKWHLQRCLMSPTEAMTCLFIELIRWLNTLLKSTAASTGPAYVMFTPRLGNRCVQPKAGQTSSSDAFVWSRQTTKR